jgi:cob(I)alamin adenosyltransferase
MAFSITTRRGDDGGTDLLFGERVSKNHPRIIALGDVDELNAALGWVRVHGRTTEAQQLTEKVQLQLINLMGELATPRGKEARYQKTHSEHELNAAALAALDATVEKLEREGDFKFKGWVLPGGKGNAAGAACDLARTVCRRAERSVLALQGTEHELQNAEVVRYLNRLSDVLWLLARWEERDDVANSATL